MVDVRPDEPEAETSEQAAILKAIRLAGSEEKLANLIGYTQPAINKAKRAGRASPEMALAIDAALAPNVTKAGSPRSGSADGYSRPIPTRTRSRNAA